MDSPLLTQAKCRSCRLQTPCLAEALDNRIEFGVWGGMTERERRALLRRRKDVPDWAQLLKNAQAAYDQARTPQLPVGTVLPDFPVGVR